MPVAYPDGTYEIIPEQARANVLLISNATQNGLSGRGSTRRTALFTYFGKFIILYHSCFPGMNPEALFG